MTLWKVDHKRSFGAWYHRGASSINGSGLVEAGLPAHCHQTLRVYWRCLLSKPTTEHGRCCEPRDASPASPTLNFLLRWRTFLQPRIAVVRTDGHGQENLHHTQVNPSQALGTTTLVCTLCMFIWQQKHVIITHKTCSCSLMHISPKCGCQPSPVGLM